MSPTNVREAISILPLFQSKQMPTYCGGAWGSMRQPRVTGTTVLILDITVYIGGLGDVSSLISLRFKAVGAIPKSLVLRRQNTLKLVRASRQPSETKELTSDKPVIQKDEVEDDNGCPVGISLRSQSFQLSATFALSCGTYWARQPTRTPPRKTTHER